uniref:Putative ovule protein n=1 Tax=Solanum chacoense TaxID=4108 RepID=A0A0V0I9U1_SOLCH
MRWTKIHNNKRVKKKVIRKRVQINSILHKEIRNNFNFSKKSTGKHKRRNNNQLQAPRGHTRQEEQSNQQAGINTIPTQNTFIILDVQESSPSLGVLDKYKGNTSDNRPHTAAIKQQGQAEYNRKPTGQDNTNQQLQVDIIATQVTESTSGEEVSIRKAGTGIASILPPPNPIDNVNIIAEVAVGGLDGRENETHTDLQEGVSTGGRELTHARHEEVEFDHSKDSRAPATPIDNQQKTATTQVTDTGQKQDRFNNKAGDRLSKKKRETIKRRLQQSIGKDSTGTDTGKQLEEHDDKQVNKGNKVKVPPDDYGALNSEDVIDPDNQSMKESDEDAEDTMQQTGQVFGSSFQDKCTDVQRVTEQQGLSPRGRKQTRHQPHQPITSMSDTSSRPMTRSKSKGY